MKKRINEVIKTDATVVELQDFMATHLPFKKLKYYTSGVEAIKGKELNEEDFFYEFIENTKDKHNFIVVQGDNGSGKSHFIRWLKNKIESEGSFPNDVVILLERSQNTLQATIKQLVNNEIIQSFLSAEEKVKLKNTGVELSEEKFISMINYNFIIEVEKEEEDEDCILKARHRKNLVEFLKEEIVQEKVLFRENGPIKRISNKLINSEDNSINENDIRFTEKDFDISIDIATAIKEAEGNRKADKFAEILYENRKGIRSNVANYLNTKIDTVIQRTIKLNAGDLNGILEKIRIKLKEINKNLILFIEDITAFTGVDKGVIESLIVEHREDNGLCRLFSVIGVTTGYYQSHFPDNLKDRVTGRVFIDSDSLFNEDNDVLELAARYINAIYVEKNELKKWVKNGAIDLDLPINESEKEWDKFSGNSNKEFSLFPLTERAIINLYNEIEDKKTPRRFIKSILLPILLHYVNDSKFPEGLKEFESELSIPKFKNELINKRIDLEINDETENSRTKCLLRVWGDGTIDCFSNNNVKYIGGIDERIFNEFNIIKVEGNKVAKVSSPVAKKDKIIEEGKPLKIIETQSVKDNITDKYVEEESKIEKHPVPKRFKEMNLIEKDIENWYKYNHFLKRHAQIRIEIVSIIKEGISWDLEDVSTYLVNEIINLNNVKIIGQQSGDEEEKNIIWIQKSEDDYYFMLSLMKYKIIGNKTWNYENSQDDMVIISRWLEINKEKIINFILNGNDTNYDIYKYSLVAEIYSKAINENNKKIKEMGLIDLYKFVTIQLKLKDKNVLMPVLGEFAIYYNSKESDINNNHTFILEYFNCPLGKGKRIFLDSNEILERLNYIIEKNFDINKLNDIKLKNCKDLWYKPYELAKKMYGNDLKLALDKKSEQLKQNNKEYLNSIDDIGIINMLFETLENNNIHFDANIKSEFSRLFRDSVSFENYIRNKKIIDNISALDMIDRIYVLNSNIQNYLRDCNNVLENIDNIIKSQELNYKNQTTNNLITDEDIRNIKNQCIFNINDMKSRIAEMEEELKC